SWRQFKDPCLHAKNDAALPAAYNTVVLGHSRHKKLPHRQFRVDSAGCIEWLPRVRYSPELIEHRTGEAACLLHFVEHLGLAGIVTALKLMVAVPSSVRFFGGA